MPSHKILNIHPLDKSLQDTFSKELKISKILSQLLINRHVKTVKEAEEFLKVKISNLLDPDGFSDMRHAVELIKKSALKKETVMLCGDYDVDGITSIAILKNTLSSLGIRHLHYIPHRVKEGYGLNKNAVLAVKEKKAKLVITADCGISNHEEIKALRESGVEVILTDHHEPSNLKLPSASAIINPKLKHCKYGFKDLAGVGVAFKLCQALLGKVPVEELDLVSLGTIADVVPLRGENRIIAKEGLKRLNTQKRIGIEALVEVSRLKNKQINSAFVSFILGPRINASGRVDTAESALQLLLSEKKEEAELLAKNIEANNRQRQKIEGKILEEAHDLISREINFKEHQVIVVAKEGWHHGVLGIVASKLADKFYRPTIVISLSELHCKGSGRSIKNFHLFQALSECSGLLESFGGHSHAVGLVVTKDNLTEFKKEINRLAKEKLRLEDLLPSLDIDMELALADISDNLVEELEALEPFGTGNPEPLFYTRSLRLKGEPQVLGRETLKFWVTDGKFTHQAIGFGMAHFLSGLALSQTLDLVYTPRMDNWQGDKKIILEAKDIFFKQP